MTSLILLCQSSIAARLAALGAPWNRAGGESPAPEGKDGAWVEFYGVVRGMEGDAPERRISAIDYEAHPEMAVHQMEEIVKRLGEVHPLSAVLVIHRVGRVPVGEASLLVRIVSPHREEALAACREFLDQLKTLVPIWKHPIPAADGRGVPER